jgi:hypothetical protein
MEVSAMTESAEPAAPPALLLHARFLELLPRVEACARFAFRHLACPHQFQDYVQETVSLSWAWYRRLANKGKDASRFISALAAFAARAVRCGRRVAGQESIRDVLSPAAQRRGGFRIERLPTCTRTAMEDRYAAPGGQRVLDAFEERLAAHGAASPAEAAGFRVDFREFLDVLSSRDREMMRFLSLGYSGKETAQRFRLSPGRVTQKRVRWCRDWFARHGEQPPARRRPRQASARPAPASQSSNGVRSHSREACSQEPV